MLKKILSNFGTYKRSAILAPLLVTIEVAFEIFIPYVLALLIDNGVNAGNLSEIYKYGAILIGIVAVSAWLGITAGFEAAKASAGLGRNLRRNMFLRVQSFAFGNIDKFSAASIITRLGSDVTNVENACQMTIRIAARAPSLLIYGLIASIALNPSLSVMYAIAVPFLGFGLIFIAQFVHPTFVKVFRSYDVLNNVVKENLSGIRVVKSFVREEFEKEKFGEISRSVYKDFTYAEKILAFNNPIVQIAMYFCVIFISWVGARLIVVDGSMTTGELMSALAYTNQILFGLIMLTMIFVMMIISRESARRIVEILEEEPDLKNPPHPVFETPNGDIEFEGVSFGYVKDKTSLKNVNLKINSGETAGIIGGIGASKSTLVQLIPRLYDASEGAVKVGGIDVRNYDLKTLRDSVAMVLQKNVLFSGTIAENVRWGDESATLDEIKRVCRLAQADGFIEEFPDGYETYVEQGGTNLSGGQKQRLCIARALLKNPKILILDDSTSAVDAKTDAQIMKAFNEEIPNVTRIIIAQRISSVESLDKIIVMDGGEINDVGTSAELLERNQIYQEVYNSQQRIEGAL
jgi:ATP-binding cassette subfamily B protein